MEWVALFWFQLVVTDCVFSVGLVKSLRWLIALRPPPYRETLFYFDVPPTRAPFVALTLDDAPPLDQKSGRRLLQLLQENHAKATFFVISNDTVRYSKGTEFLKLAVANGHEVANHLVHDERADGMSPEKFEERLMQCEAILENVDPGYSERQVKWYRPPWGLMSQSMMDPLNLHNYKPVLGDVYPLDAQLQKECQNIIGFILRNVQPGSVVILHTPSEKFREQNFEVLRVTLKEMWTRGYDIVTLSEALTRSKGIDETVDTEEATTVKPEGTRQERPSDISKRRSSSAVTHISPQWS